MQGTLQIMSPTQGDEVIEWDTTDEKSVNNARVKFAKALKKGMMAYAETVVEKVETVQIREFDPSLNKITMRPALAGG